MKIINADAKYFDANNQHPYKFMERIGRICYRSENNITETSDVKFVQGLLKRRHTAMLEHAHIILKVHQAVMTDIDMTLTRIATNSETCENISVRNYFNITEASTHSYMSGSFRAFITLFDIEDTKNNDGVKALKKLLYDAYPEIFETFNPEDVSTKGISILNRDEFKDSVYSNFKQDDAESVIKKHMTHTVVFTTDRGVTHEFVRHRPASFAQESTRYCNYIQDKFGNEITVIYPSFFKEGTEEYNIWRENAEMSEKAYFRLINLKRTPQEARDVLPAEVKTELVITATEQEWQHIINLRYHGTTGAPHPQMKEVMTIAYPLLVVNSDSRIG